MTRTPLVLIAAAATILALSACANDSDVTAAGASTAAGTSATERPTRTPTEDTGHNAADVMFAQMMLPHHEQAITMSELVLDKDGIPDEVARLAEQIMSTQETEARQLTDWLDQWGERGLHESGMSEMEGVLTDAEVQRLSEAEGADAARLFMEQMIAHHEGAVTMAEGQVLNGSYPPAINMADAVIDAQRHEIMTMNDLLDNE